ncbi:MAG TPA: hypothetical protein PK297_13010, partial [Spirochaetota bacterium]|nr:hypothetical protein [Spirochaetota bacterium]
MIQASAGDASSFIEGSSLKIKTYNNPDARSAIEPAETYVGATSVYLYVSTTNINSPDISELRIRIPDGYNISADNTSGNTYSSLIISADASYVTKISENGTNYIKVDYKGAGTFLPASGGMDRIAITVASTPAGFTGATTNTVWQASVNSEIPGTVRTVCRQDSAYNNMALLVRQLPPVMIASISTIPEGTTNTLYNNNHYNLVTVAVQNNGGIGNLIKRIRIQMPTVVSAVDVVSSSVIGGTSGIGMNYDNVLNQVIVDYASQSKVLNPGQSDIITFNIQDSVGTMSDPVIHAFPVAADNENEEGYVAATEGSQTWRIRWKRPDAAGSASVVAVNGLATPGTNYIYTSTTGTTRLELGINNTGGTANVVRFVEITIPAQFTNIANAASSFYAASPITLDGNRILVKYGDAGLGIPEGQSDTVSVDLKDAVGLTQEQVAAFSVRLANTLWESNLQPTGEVPGKTKKVNFIRPPLLATMATLPIQIDSDVLTHQLVTTIVNTGEPENIIGELRIYVPDFIVTNIVNSAASLILGENSFSSSDISVSTTGLSNFVRVTYPPAKPFRGGMTETITFSIVHCHPGGATNLTLVATASNVRNLWQKLGTTSGGTNTLTIRKPPAQGKIALTPNVLYHHDGGALVSTNLLVLTLTNTGTTGNDITSAVVNFPSLLQYKVVSVSNDSGAGIANQLASQSRITIDYSSLKLQATKSDKIYIWFRTDMASQIIDQSFSCSFDNGEGLQVATVPAGKSSALSLVTRPEICLAQNDATPNQIYTTDAFSSFTFTFKNGVTGGKPIARLRIDVPNPFISTGAVLSSPWPSSTEVFETTNGQSVFVNYSASKLDAGSSDEVSVGLRDNFVIGTTNIVFTAWADYGDGGAFKPVRVTTGKSMGVEFVFPDATAYATVTPRLVNMNSVSNQFTVIVTNTGVAGNHIKKMEIDLGKYVTNVGLRSSAILGAGAGTVISNRYLLLDYAASATNLPSGYKDTITVAALDSADEVTNVTIRIRVSNTTSDEEYRVATEQTTGGLKISYFRPDYLGSAYVEAVNRVSADKPNTVYSTVTTSTLRYTLVNDGAADNDLDAMRLYLPDVYVDTATLSSITSQRGGIVDLSGSVLTIWYTNGTKLASTQRDTIQFAVVDRVSSTNAVSRWISTSRFMTSGGKFLTNQLVAGKSDSINFEMPAPAAKARLRQRMIYATTPRFMTVLDITNAGSGSNAVETVRISIPAGMQPGFGPGMVTNSFAAAKAYTAGVLTLTYTNFTVGKVDTLWLDLTNTYTDVYSGKLAMTVANKVLEKSVAEWTTDALLQRVVTAPSVYAEAVSPRDGVENRLWSTDFEAQYRVYVRNDGTGDAAIRRVHIRLPAGFSVSAASSGAVGGSGLSFSSNTVSIDYPGAFPFAASQWDAITITAA